MMIVFTTILVDWIGFSVLIPVLPLYAVKLGAQPHQVGLILTVYALAQLLFLPAWGWVSDRIGRRPVILFSLFGTAASFLLLREADTMAALLGGSTLEWIYAARALAGFFAASIGTAQAVVTDVTPVEDRAGGMGMIGAAFGVGMILGPTLGGFLALYSPQAPFDAIVILALVNLVVAWFRLPETKEPDTEPARWGDLGRSLIPTPLRLIAAVHDRRIALFLILFFFQFTAFAALEGQITFFLGQAHGATALQVALVFAWIGFIMVLTQGFLLRRLVAKVGESPLVLVGLAAMGVGLAAVAFAPSLIWFYPVGGLIAFGNGLAFPSFTSLYSKACVAGQAGELLAQSQSMATTGRIVGPVAAGLAMEHWSLGTPFIAAGAIMFGCLIFFSITRKTLLEGL
jgi:MFS family permease